MKWLVLLLICLPVLVSAGVITDDTLCVTNTVWHDLTAASIIDSTWGISTSSLSAIVWEDDCNPKHDTAKEYIKDIKYVCDTLWAKEWKEIGKSVSGKTVFEAVTIMDSIVCRDDTIWAEKQFIRFTPDEIEKLRKLLD